MFSSNGFDEEKLGKESDSEDGCLDVAVFEMRFAIRAVNAAIHHNQSSSRDEQNICGCVRRENLL
ncbi:MAG: hypothetical protein JWO71_3185 [Candidatus Acidoferrum typicum]|nr:hypothetical protein [Candidatus Acidoferrum typicum]